MCSNHIIISSLLLLLLAIVTHQKCDKTSQEFLVTFHPHLDAFWLNTDDELKNIKFSPAGFLYAMNQRNSKQIYNSMLLGLLQDPKRKYLTTEIVFFKDWYDYLSTSQKDQVKQLIKNNQLQISNGGWVENDEAVCYYDDILDQYTIGHNFINQQFGKQTKIGWATDCFGHSHSQVALQHLLGFQFQAIERIDDRYIYDRNEKPLLEFYWQAVSDSNNRSYGGVVTYIRHFLHEVNDLRTTSPQRIVADFNQLKPIMKKLYRKNKQFRFLGNDFEQFIPSQFKKLEESFDLLNKQHSNPQCPQYKYGNPTEYLELLKQEYENQQIESRKYDLMPNFDQDHYWTGYYTTDPQLKKACKDFSRIVNLFRKLLFKNPQKAQSYLNLIKQSQQLLSVMQHHDGITATSKRHIQQLFKDRMKNKTLSIVQAIASLSSSENQQGCSLFANGNTCKVSINTDIVFFSVLHQGSKKVEKIEIQLSKGFYYDVQRIEDEEIFCRDGKCALVFKAELHPGKNVFTLRKQANPNNIIQSESITTTKIKQQNYELEVRGSIDYTFFNNEFYNISLVQSNNGHSSAQTQTWNKYGKKMKKQQSRVAGMYIMSNTGNLTNIPQSKFQTLQHSKGKIYTKFHITSRIANIVLTIQNSQPNIIDIETSFKPFSRVLMDYFIKISSKNFNSDTFYHDMNGYLVSQRKIGYRPDYKWTYRTQDKINANNYPVCSFAYAFRQDKKLVLMVDHAYGFTTYDGAFLLNIDRLTSDDYKGVGEGYMYLIQNTFRQRIALVDKNNFIERQWQRQYDDALMGFVSPQQKNPQITTSEQVNPVFKNLKYNILILNDKEYLLRLHNLHQTDNFELSLHGQNSWEIKQLGLKFQYIDIKESFANGFVLNFRKSWVNNPAETNVFNAASRDTLQSLVLSPLQIRSFRINTKNKIESKAEETKPSSDPLANIKVNKLIKKIRSLKKRCF